MSEYKSLHERLLGEGFIVDNYFGNKNIPEGLNELALNIARGQYEQVRILPADIALQGETWMPTESYHLVYVTLSEEEKKARGGTALMLRMVECENVHTGEVNRVPFPKYRK